MRVAIERPADVPPETWEAFMTYHRENPGVWKEFERLALQAINEGVKKWGAKGIFEVVRWNLRLEGDDGQGAFKANNNFCSYYSRVFQSKHPHHASFFETRKVTGLKEAA